MTNIALINMICYGVITVLYYQLSHAVTIGGKHAFVFTQCQAIHARSLLPCQDSPGVKFTYRAVLRVPQELTALMGAIPVGEIKDGKLIGLPVPAADKVAFSFEQPVPIPSYLMGLAIGNIHCREIGPRYTTCFV